MSRVFLFTIVRKDFLVLQLGLDMNILVSTKFKFAAGILLSILLISLSLMIGYKNLRKDTVIFILPESSQLEYRVNFGCKNGEKLGLSKAYYIGVLSNKGDFKFSDKININSDFIFYLNQSEITDGEIDLTQLILINKYVTIQSKEKGNWIDCNCKIKFSFNLQDYLSDKL